MAVKITHFAKLVNFSISASLVFKISTISNYDFKVNNYFRFSGEKRQELIRAPFFSFTVLKDMLFLPIFSQELFWCNFGLIKVIPDCGIINNLQINELQVCTNSINCTFIKVHLHFCCFYILKYFKIYIFNLLKSTKVLNILFFEA